MNYYIFIYSFSIVLCIIGGYILHSQYKNLSGFYFFLTSIFASFWFLTYFLFFSGFVGSNYLTLVSRSAYAFGILGVYSFLIFVAYFGKPVSTQPKHLFPFGIFSICILGMYVETNWIIAGLRLENGVHREITGNLYPMHIFLHSGFVILLIITAIKQIKKQTYLNRIRLKNILFFGAILVGSLLIFQLILPYFGIWMFEKELVAFFVLFVIATIYTIKRYYFPRLGHGLSRATIIMFSFFGSVYIFQEIKKFSLAINNGLSDFWSSQDEYGILNALVIIVLYTSLYYLSSKILLGTSRANIDRLQFSLSEMQKQIPYILNLEELNIYLKKKFISLFSTQISNIHLIGEGDELKELSVFFKYSEEKIFINDIVFFEEQCTHYDTEKILTELGNDVCMAFPLYGDEISGVIGVFRVGFKPLGDFYTIDEIDRLRAFVAFLELHLKYLQSTEQLQELSRSLDEKVDKKTIEYNDLINKQKEFISTISHEIKSPIAGAIVQTDGIIDDLKGGTEVEIIEKELELLSTQLLKIGDLTSKLFSVQYYDTHSVTLFKERVQMRNLLNMEIDIYETTHERVEFMCDIDREMGFIEIDRIQFQQVITNLLTNAIKFSHALKPKIYIGARTENNIFFFTIEDNGRGFTDMDIESLFEKYSIGTFGSVGLGLGLYLCKRIIEMHGGKISAGISQRLGGGKIQITLPF